MANCDILSPSRVEGAGVKKFRVTFQMGNRQLTPIDANLNHALRLRGSSTRSIRVHWRSFTVDLNNYNSALRS